MTDSIRVPLGDEWRASPVAEDGTILDPGHYVVHTWACSCGFENRGIPAVNRMHDLHHRTVHEIAERLDAATARALAAEEAAERLRRVETAATILCTTVERLPDYHGNREWLLSMLDDVRTALAAANRTASGDET